MGGEPREDWEDQSPLDCRPLSNPDPPNSSLIRTDDMAGLSAGLYIDDYPADWYSQGCGDYWARTSFKMKVSLGEDRLRIVAVRPDCPRAGCSGADCPATCTPATTGPAPLRPRPPKLPTRPSPPQTHPAR